MLRYARNAPVMGLFHPLDQRIPSAAPDLVLASAMHALVGLQFRLQ
jgi:hypothetical protein